MMMFGRLLLAAALSFAALPAVAQTKPKVVATFSIVGDLVAQVAGDRIDLAVLVGADTDAHTYQPKPSDARTLAAAQAMVSNGLGFEGWIDRLETLRQGIAGSRVVQFEHSSHTAHLEETDAYLPVVRAFLAEADAGS